jgi:cytochrome c oxidase subunit 2
MPGNRVVLALLAAVLPVAAVLIALSLPGVAPPSGATDSGRAIYQLYWVVFAITAIVFVLVEATLLAFIVRYRRRPRAHEHAEGPQIHGNTRIELAWTLIPTVILIALAVYTFTQVPTVQATGDAGPDAIHVEITAHQFYWQYDYGEGRYSYDKLYLPVDRPIVLRIVSADVDHSWWVPDLTGKRDAIPGRVNILRFQTEEVGLFTGGVCGEFCGTQHARMTTEVEVLEQADFEAWLADQGAADDVKLGETQWRAACAKCHGLEGEGDVGPPIAQNPILGDPEQLKRLVYEGADTDASPNYMPPVGLGWTDEQIATLVAYIQSNPKLAPPGGQGGG